MQKMLIEFSMIGCQKRFIVVYMVLLLAFGLSSDLCRAQSASNLKFESESLSWSRLSFKADSLFGQVTTEVRLAALPSTDAADQLIAVPQAAVLQPSGATVISTTVDSNINPLFGSNEILKTQSWSNSDDAAALQLVRLRQGGKIWQKSYRFEPSGVYHQRKKPADKKQLELPPEQWSTFEKKFYRYDSKKLGCPVVLEPNGLLYLVSALDYEKLTSPLILCVFNKKQLHLVKVSFGGLQSLKVNYLEKQGENKSQVLKDVDTIKISFHPRSLAPTNIETEEFSFLGLKGDFDIFIDKTSRIPVLVRGKITEFGKMEILLQQVLLSSENK